MLSHRNLHANRHQVGARIAFNRQDIVFNALPMFHSFGLTVGTLLPVLAGIRTFLYPSPLHYRIMPELIYQTNATVFFGTDTFLRGYARMANPYDFHSVRIVGRRRREGVGRDAPRLVGATFGLRILEGYGATETAPVIAFNTPMHFRAGTVGRLMPGIEHRLEPVAGIAEGGRLHVRGPNVMLGYMRETAPGELKPVAEGWYDTGDIVSIDADGFVAIQGRAKRFAKIARRDGVARRRRGACRTSFADLPARGGRAAGCPQGRAGGARQRGPEPRRGIASSSSPASAGMPEIMLPRDVLHVDALPLLGTGKTDYPAIEALARKPVLQVA